MKGTPEQIKHAMDIKSRALDRVFGLVKNEKTIEMIIQFANSKQDANWWILKSVLGENFLITEHQKTITSNIDNSIENQVDNGSDVQIRLLDFQLPKWIVDWLIKQPEQPDILIKKALIQVYQIQPPTEKNSL